MKAIKNIIITHLVMLVLFAGAAMALAQDSASTTGSEDTTSASGTRLQERRAEMQQNAEERQVQMEERREEVKANIDEKRSQLQAKSQIRITNLAANMSNRIEAVLTRLQNITERIDLRIQKLNELGVDTEAAAAALASAEMSIDAAYEEISTIDEDVNGAIGSEDVKANWVTVKEKYRKIHAHIMTARTELQACVAALKKAVADYQETNNGVDEAVKTEI